MTETTLKGIVLAVCAVLAFLVPIGIYCLILASINRRAKPLVVSGVWDAIGLLFAVSGFFLATIPMLLAEFYARTLAENTSDHFLHIWLQHWLLWLVYFLFLLSGAALMLLWRSHKTMIYNVDPEQFPRALERTFELVGLAVKRNNRRLLLTPTAPSASQESTAITQDALAAQPTPDDTLYAELEIDTFAPLCHVTLLWDNYAPELRRQIENELVHHLDAAAPLENPVAGWFLNISGMIFGALVMVVLTFVTLILFSGR
jgi:hypothetical protein